MSACSRVSLVNHKINDSDPIDQILESLIIKYQTRRWDSTRREGNKP